ncbi:MAG: hypothetical protein M1475_05290 [Actinobacteria bacterium]|nr:hypothetical protein [Actinomycetota bacterium]
MNRPEIMVNFAEKKFSETDKLIDMITIQKVKEFMIAFGQWIIKLK